MKIVSPTLEVNREVIEDASLLLLKHEALAGIEATRCEIPDKKIAAVDMSGSYLHKIDFTSAYLEKLVANNLVINGGSMVACDFYQSVWRYVIIEHARCNGALFQMSKLRDVVFRDCKLDLVNFRFSKLQNVLFDNCLMDDADFYNAGLTNVTFDGCTINKIEFSGAKLKTVDLTASDVGAVSGVTSMKGATVSPLQVVTLAPLMAQEIGLNVQYDELSPDDEM